MTKICKTCQIEKDINDFPLGNPKTNHLGRRPHCNKCRRMRYRETHPKIVPQTTKDRDLRAAFKMTEAEYLDKLTKQNGVCANCKKPETAIRNGKVKALAVDHSHLTGKNRGLLCQKCNIGIGQFNESPELLISAAQYLRSYE